MLEVVAITGTNGKSSIAYMLAALLPDCGLIGTLGYGSINNLQQARLTTPDRIELAKLLPEFKQNKIKMIALEASSHGLLQGRLQDINITTTVFTNLTHDHLDYHKDLENYWQAKRKLFFDHKYKNAVLNLDSSYGTRLAVDLYGNNINIIGYSTKLQNTIVPAVLARNIEYSITGIKATISTPWGDHYLNVPLFGEHNLENVLAMIAVAGAHGIPLKRILEKLTIFTGIPGRMQVVNNQPLVVIDYAHTPDALEKVLQAMQNLSRGKLWLIFGCGGDRDQSKRPLMGEIAGRLADKIILTNDNPRNEDPNSIITQIKSGISANTDIAIKLDRKAAIAYAMIQAASDDRILIAGKGHERYQQIGAIKQEYSDQKIVEELCLE